MFRVSGYLLIVIGVIHVLVGFWICAKPIADIVRNGLFNAISPNIFAPNFDREAAFWFMMFALPLFALGQLCFWVQAQGIVLPTFLGWNLLAISVIGIFFVPISGFWLLILPAILMVRASSLAR